jgi:hypothetical protein
MSWENICEVLNMTYCAWTQKLRLLPPRVVHPTKESLDSKTLSQFPLNLSDREEQHPLPVIPAYEPWEETRHWESPCQSVGIWIWNQRKDSRIFSKLMLFSFIFSILISIFFNFYFIHMYIQCLGHFFPLSPIPSLPLPYPSLPRRNYSALISNFVEEKV